MSAFPYERQLRAALADLLGAYENRGETTSLAEWDARMKAAAIHARTALGNERPFQYSDGSVSWYHDCPKVQRNIATARGSACECGATEPMPQEDGPADDPWATHRKF